MARTPTRSTTRTTRAAAPATGAPLTRRRTLSDPLTLALKPAVDEAPEVREYRLAQEREAKRINDEIDDMIKLEKQRLATKRREVKLLLLGQSESGKSTTLKQFQIMYSPAAFQAECMAWRPIIYLNLVRSIRRLLELVTPPSISLTRPTTAAQDPDDPSGFRSPPRSPVQLGFSDAHAAIYTAFEPIRSRLFPVIALEEVIIRRLSEPEDGVEYGSYDRVAAPPTGMGRNKEVFVQSSAGGWKRALGKLSKPRDRSMRGGSLGQDSWALARHDPSDPVHVLNACQDDMIELWHDPRIQEILRRKKIRPQENSGFYLNDIARVTAVDYMPTGDDVLKARLKTIGVSEHVFSLDKGVFGQEKGVDWKVIDVGGARNQRQAWAQFFDDADALIFLAPISAFDQVLAEDPEVNRVEDSLLLWRSLCSNKLLANVNVILFLNKCDLLKEKLDAGVKLGRYMSSYGDRPNDYRSVAQYFRTKFVALHQSFSPNQKRDVFVHLTCVTDTQATATIIINVRDIILRNALKNSNLL